MAMRFYAAFMYLSLICPLLCCTGHGSKIEQIADTLQLKGLGYYDTLVQIECPIAYNSFSINHVIKHTRYEELIAFDNTFDVGDDIFTKQITDALHACRYEGCLLISDFDTYTYSLPRLKTFSVLIDGNFVTFVGFYYNDDNDENYFY